MIKVIEVLTDTNIGGAGIWLLNFLEFYDREKLDVSVVIPTESMLKERIEKLGVRVIEAESIGDISFSVDGLKELLGIFKAENPQVIHTHASLSARLAAKKLKIPVVNTRHCIEPEKKGIKKLIYGYINRFLSDYTVAVSKRVKENLIADGIAEDNIFVVYNGVKPLYKYSEFERIQARRRMGVDGCFVFGIFARLEEVKNHSLFLKAAASSYEVSDKFRFIIVGDGSLMEDLKKEAEDLGLKDAVLFTGFMPDITELMNVVDINVLTSYSEAMSISLVEGMSVGKPSISTDSGGPKEVIENGRTGVIVPNNDSVNLTFAFLRLATDKKLLEEFGKEAQRVAKEKFSPEEMAEKLLKIYEKVSGKGVANEEV